MYVTPANQTQGLQWTGAGAHLASNEEFYRHQLFGSVVKKKAGRVCQALPAKQGVAGPELLITFTALVQGGKLHK